MTNKLKIEYFSNLDPRVKKNENEFKSVYNKFVRRMESKLLNSETRIDKFYQKWYEMLYGWKMCGRKRSAWHVRSFK